MGRQNRGAERMILSKIRKMIDKYKELYHESPAALILGKNELYQAFIETSFFYKESLIEMLAKNKNPLDFCELFGINIILVLEKNALYLVPHKTGMVLCDEYIEKMKESNND